MMTATAVRTIPFGRPWIDDQDREAVLEVLRGPILTHGPECKAFEEEFSAFMGDGAYCVSVSSCMAALHLAYFFMGIGPGDEVIVPAQTHAATAHAVELVGAKPVFADCDSTTGNIDCSRVESLITPKTKALSLVHFVGIPCDMEEIVAIANRFNLKIVEDCALAVGARYKGKHVGLFGDVGCFSFYPVKHITTGEGGMFVSRHKEVADTVARVRAFGTDRSHSVRAIPGLYDVAALGLNYRMSEMQAALGRQQIGKLGEILYRRRTNFSRLKSLLTAIDGISVLDSRRAEAQNSYYCCSVLLQGKLATQRNEIVSWLNHAGVGTSIYYPHPVPRLSYYRGKYDYRDQEFPNASAISDHSIALPVGPHLDLSDIEYIAQSFREAVEEIK